jgi:hypothetical protein
MPIKILYAFLMFSIMQHVHPGFCLQQKLNYSVWWGTVEQTSGMKTEKID